MIEDLLVVYNANTKQILSANITNGANNLINRELNQKVMEAESELDDVRNQKSAGEMDKDTELGKKYTDHL